MSFPVRFAIILLRKREVVALLCVITVVWLFYLSVFGTKAISSDEGSIDISDTILVTFVCQEMRKYLSDIRESENCIEPKL